MKQVSFLLTLIAAILCTVHGFHAPSGTGREKLRVRQLTTAVRKRTIPTSTTLFQSKKETTWDRITGPKLFKTVTSWEGIHAVPLVPLRILTGLLMIHHGSEGGFGPANFGTEQFNGFADFVVKPYFGFLPGSPYLWSAIHDYVEYFGGMCFALGFLIRPASLSLLVTMLSAIYFHLSAVGLQGFPFGHVPNYSYDFEEPLLYALIFLVFWFNGAGPLSIDSIIYGKISNEVEDIDYTMKPIEEEE